MNEYCVKLPRYSLLDKPSPRLVRVIVHHLFDLEIIVESPRAELATDAALLQTAPREFGPAVFFN
jgi:hypothetical protein